MKRVRSILTGACCKMCPLFYHVIILGTTATRIHTMIEQQRRRAMDRAEQYKDDQGRPVDISRWRGTTPRHLAMPAPWQPECLRGTVSRGRQDLPRIPPQAIRISGVSVWKETSPLWRAATQDLQGRA